LQVLVAVVFEAGGLTIGREVDEARMLWAAAVGESASRVRGPLDEEWLTGVLARRASKAGLQDPPRVRRQDWGEAPDVIGFAGRATDLETCRAWLLQERCHVLALLGMGGIGKTMLAARLAEDVAATFQCVYWRSVRDAQPLSEWLAGAIGFVSDHQSVAPPGESERLALLLELLRERRSLLVLDNFETLLEPGHRAGDYRADCAGYGYLLQAIGEGRHQSCLLVTSREAPPELTRLGGAFVRSLELGGLLPAEGSVLFTRAQLKGSPEVWGSLVGRFGGNALALKVVAERIRQLFGGDVGAFLREEAASGIVFGDIRRLLAEQIDRSSALEEEVLRALAVDREPVSLNVLLEALGLRAGRAGVLDAVEALRRRSLVERAQIDGTTAFTLQSVVLEYVTDSLVQGVANEVERGQPALLVEQPLVKAQAKEYVRQAQERLIAGPILQSLSVRLGESGTRQQLVTLLGSWRNRPTEEQGYGPGNAVNLLRLSLQNDLREMDLSRLVIRQAYLAGVDARDASLVDAHLLDAVLAEAFPPPLRVALGGDDALLAVGTSTGDIWLYRIADRTPVLTIRGHASAVWGVALSADGRLLASASDDGTVRLWDASSGRALATMLGHTSGVRAVALSRDGHLLASGSADGTVRLWDIRSVEDSADLQSERAMLILRGHAGTVTGVTLSHDARLLASASDDGTVRIWEVPGGRALATLEDHTGAVWGVALSADGQLLATGNVDGSVKLWDTDSGRVWATLRGHTSAVWGVALAGEGQLLASSSADGAIRLWDVPGGRALAILQGHTSMVTGVAISQDGRSLASSSPDGSVRLWDSAGGRVIASLQGHTRAIFSVSLSADGQVLVSGHADGTARVWDVTTRRPVAALTGHTGAIRVTLSADGRLLATGGADCSIRLWEVATNIARIERGEVGQLLATLLGHSSAVIDVGFSEDRRFLASGSADGTVRLWEVSSGRMLRILQGHANAVRGVALSADGLLLASGGADGNVRLWATLSGTELANLRGHTSGVWSVAFLADGRSLASGSEDGTVRLWDIASGRELATLEGHTGAVMRVSASTGGQLLASASGDGTVRLWELPGGRGVATLHGHTSTVFGVAASSDGRLLASGSGDGTIKLWETDGGSCLGTLQDEPCYARLDITGLRGVTAAQRAGLMALGAVEHRVSPGATDSPAGFEPAR
jgi:WD40 repeat protein